jgi:antitoxin ParD1/3/4
MTVTIELTPELEDFVQRSIATGRYGTLDDAVADGLRLLRYREEQRAELNRSLDEARAEAERDGTFTIDEVMDEIDKMIEEEERGRAA